MEDRHKTKARLVEELNQAQQKVARLRELNHLHKIQLEVMGQAVLMIDLGRKVTVFNSHAEQLYSMVAGDVVGRDFWTC